MRYQDFEDYDVAFGDIPRLSDEQVLLAPYKSIQEAADDRLTDEQLDESFDNIEAAVLKLKANGDW